MKSLWPLTLCLMAGCADFEQLEACARLADGTVVNPARCLTFDAGRAGNDAGVDGPDASVDPADGGEADAGQADAGAESFAVGSYTLEWRSRVSTQALGKPGWVLGAGPRLVHVVPLEQRNGADEGAGRTHVLVLEPDAGQFLSEDGGWTPLEGQWSDRKIFSLVQSIDVARDEVVLIARDLKYDGGVTTGTKGAGAFRFAPGGPTVTLSVRDSAIAATRLRGGSSGETHDVGLVPDNGALSLQLSPEPVGQMPLAAPCSTVRRQATLAGGIGDTWVTLADCDGTIQSESLVEWTPSSVKQRQSPVANGQLAASPNGNHLRIAGESGNSAVVTTSVGAPAARLLTDGQLRVVALSVRNDGRTAVLLEGSSLRLKGQIITAPSQLFVIELDQNLAVLRAGPIAFPRPMRSRSVLMRDDGLFINATCEPGINTLVCSDSDAAFVARLSFTP